MTYGGVHSPQLLTAHKLQPVGFGTHEHCCYIANGSALEKVGYPAGAYARAVSGQAMTTKQQTYRNSTGLIIALAVIGLFIFLPVWINVFIAPIYLIVHGLLVLGLTKIKGFQSTMKPIKFGLIISGIPLGLLLIQNIFTIPLYISTKSNLGEILVVTGLTFIVCLANFFITYFIYKHWWTKKKV